MPVGSCGWWTAGSGPLNLEAEIMPRVQLPVLRDEAPQGHVSCLQCAKCCSYVAVGINAPTTARLATEILWHLYHQGVTVCRDDAGEWYVQFEARCKHLGEGNLCAVYLNRPHICRAYDDQSCEVNAPQEHLIEFKDPRKFLEYLRETRPRVYQAIDKAHIPADLRPSPLPPRSRNKGRRKAAGSAVR